MTYQKSITVYLGSSGHCRSFFKNEAAALGQAIARSGYRLVYGGMDAGLMGILANTVIENGGAVLGIVPRKIKDILRFHKNLSEHILVDTLWERKRLLFRHGDAIAVFPGGFGTLDEALEVLYWAALGLHTKPVVFINSGGYWDNALAYLRTLPDLPEDSFSAVDTVEDLIPAIEAGPGGTEADTTANLPHFEDEIARHTRAPLIVRDMTIAESYRLVTALGLRQVGAHSRPIGLLNDGGRFERLIAWIGDAARERFITDKCPALLTVAENEDILKEALALDEPVSIDLVHEKWGVPAEVAGS
ncbi:MAG: TIGR00730 family Rossman fold protein [Alphaproteobacteria bacterium]|nr:TIGR00730 family Rossman fold protein [Alphaproteobacteria bacterium]